MNKKTTKKIIISSLIILIIAGAFLVWNLASDDTAGSPNKKIEATLYKSPNCGCCVKYISYLEKQGFSVETIPTNDMSSIKTEYQIPRNMESCHTMIIGNYFIEGHVPLAAINKLLSEKPDIDGISLPDMPAGTPGMPGIKQGEWQIYSLKDGKYSDYLAI